MAHVQDPVAEVREAKSPVVLDASSKTSEPSETAVDIYIDPEIEKAALRKFDKWLLPVAFTFLVLSSLDRSNVSSA